MVLSGKAMREYLLACCDNQTERNQLIKMAGETQLATTAGAKASIPIGWLLSNGQGSGRDYPLDFSVLNGPLQIQCNFNAGNTFTTTSAAAVPGTIAAFTDLYVTACTSDLLDGAFSVKRALNMDPNASYNLPAKYLNSTKYPVSCTPGSEITINIRS
jgi:hypothetical protein